MTGDTSTGTTTAGTAGKAIDQVFAAAREEGRAALIGYLPAGFPDHATSLEAMRVMVASGVDIVEVGVPYSDPLMDGPGIQAAAGMALANGFRVRHTFDAVRAVSQAGGVGVVMSYYNPVLRAGVASFAGHLAEAGGSGMITPDLIPDEAQEWREAAAAHDLAPIFLVAPSSTPERLLATAAASRGFVYASSTMGVTGVRSGAIPPSAAALVGRLREVTELPIGVGIGVSTAAQAASVAGFADGVIVGSALVKAVADDPSLTTLGTLVAELADGVRRGGKA